jgi:hypothetical protein
LPARVLYVGNREGVAVMNARLSLVASLSFAVLVGTISDRTTGQPLPGVLVAVGATHSTSRADGSYRLSGLKPGRATLTVSSNEGVPPQQFSVTVGNATSRADVRVCDIALDYNCGPPR